MRNLFAIVGLLSVFALGFFIAWQIAQPRAARIEETSADVLLEKVKSVAKLVTVEGYFSEVYSHKDYIKVIDMFPHMLKDIPAFRKKALVRVKGKVSVGYDLDRMRIDLDPETRTLRLSNLPRPDIISIEHDLEYYDLTEGTFNQFTAEDYSKLNARAKNIIEQQARQSDLFDQAEAQGNQIIDMITFLAEEAGWTVKREARPVLAN